MNLIIGNSFKNCLLLWLLLIVTMATGSLNEVTVVEEFNKCFQSSMQKLKEIDSSLAVLIDPETDPNIIAAVLPMIKVNMTDIPTEYVEDNSSLDFTNFVNFTKDEVLSTNNYKFPTNNGIKYLSMSKAERREKIRYLLFTSENKNQFQVIAKDGTLETTKFWRPERKTKVLIHGLTSTVWLPSIVNIWSQHLFEIKNAYLKQSDDPSLYNVIVMDWTALSTVTLARYPEAALGVQQAGEDLAEFLLQLRKSKNIQNWEDVHLIGHSLGAHVAGVAGNELREKGNEFILERITGLDPAGLCFDTKPNELDNPDNMLDKTDANFVDIIHTNMGNVITSIAGRYGSQMETGHADFYPDGGEVQKGCNFLEDRLNFCSHQKSVVFFANSVWDKPLACSCKSWDIFRSTDSCNCTLKSGGEYMGEYCSNTAQGKYYLHI